VPDLTAIVEARYGLSQARIGPALDGGEWNGVYRLETAHRPYVLRISHPSTTAEALGHAHDVLRFVGQRLAVVHPPLLARDGSTSFHHEGRWISLFPWVYGERLTSDADALRTAAARLLADVHRAGLRYRGAGHPQWPPLAAGTNPERDGVPERFQAESAARLDLRKLALELRQAGLDLQRLHDSVTRTVREAAEQVEPLTTGLIHGDFYPDNILESHGEITGLLDWDETRPEWLVYELGRATWEFCHQGYELDTERARSFIQAYLGVGGPIPLRETRWIVPFMRFTRLEDACFDLQQALNGDQWSEEQTEYHAANLRAAQSLAGLELGSF